MPPSAFAATERQFRTLLDAGAPACGIELRLFAPPAPGLAAPGGRPEDAAEYGDLDALWTADVDALLVTGAEPRAVAMEDEPYWPAMRALTDWAGSHTVSTLWSCLAAHAAAYRLAGVQRRLRPRKLSGVFDCERADDHPLLARGPARWRVPHSRYNTLEEADLRAAGFALLARSERAGVDSFARDEGSLFVFLQGHPEYDADTLMREYRRDIRRFVAGVYENYPEMPEGYFSAATAAGMAALRERAAGRDGHDIQPVFDAAEAAGLPHDWHAPAVRLFGNWLHLVAERIAPGAQAAAPAAVG